MEMNLKDMIEGYNLNAQNFRRELGILSQLANHLDEKNKEVLGLSAEVLKRELSLMIGVTDVLVKYVVHTSEQNKIILQTLTEKSDKVEEEVKEEILSDDEEIAEDTSTE